jgi:hypothetical protein
MDKIYELLLNIENLVASDSLKNFAPIIIASLALFLTIWQAKTQRKHNKISVKPILSGFLHQEPSHDPYPFYYFSLMNKGLGTAKIDSFTFYINDKKVSREELNSDLENLGEIYGNFLFTLGWLDARSYISKDETLKIIDIPVLDVQTPKEVFEYIHKSYKLCIKYSSLYGDKDTYGESPEKQ